MRRLKLLVRVEWIPRRTSVQPIQAWLATLEPFGHVPPAEFEDAHYRQLAESAMSA